MTSAKHLTYAIGLSILLMLASACTSSTRVTYIPDGASFGASDLTLMLESVQIEDAHDIDPNDAQQARQDALADLRTYGDDAAALADALTTDFPADVNAVPVEVWSATYEGEPAWVVIEVWGDPSEDLRYRRMWIYSADDMSLVSAHSIR
ncbi:hypothetical protein [Anaerosoma tenue]|uniref:hypothetical protein n=1 Tax=Anaerosoma tenue TaxID=2933588 RepID=UPI002260B6E2|nr:hypothetical protein [Anaerosoma tenue]MCK8115682.1 hypothetical protein [Anaerosoma tenue]